MRGATRPPIPRRAGCYSGGAYTPRDVESSRGCRRPCGGTWHSGHCEIKAKDESLILPCPGSGERAARHQSRFQRPGASGMEQPNVTTTTRYAIPIERLRSGSGCGHWRPGCWTPTGGSSGACLSSRIHVSIATPTHLTRVRWAAGRGPCRADRGDRRGWTPASSRADTRRVFAGGLTFTEPAYQTELDRQHARRRQRHEIEIRPLSSYDTLIPA